MKKTITLLALLISFNYASMAQNWSKKKIKGNGNVTTETRTTKDYSGIKCAGSMDYILVAGKEGKITIKGESNLLEHIIIEVKDDNLIVKTAKGKYISPSKGKTIEIIIPFEEIDKISLAGSGDLTSRDVIRAKSLRVSLAGSGDVNVEVSTDYVKGAVAGSGDIRLSGSTNSLEAKIAGAGDFNSFDLKADNVEVSVAGSGDAKVYSNSKLKARVAGSGDIVYKGSPEVDKKVSGSGDISKS